MGNPEIWSKYKRIHVGSPWFHVHDLGGSVYAIYEPYHFQEIISYLIVGDKKALLWDTGMGIENIKDVVDAITDKPLLVMNSHVHFDHVGCNYMFDQVMVMNEPTAISRLERGYSISEMAPQATKRLFETEKLKVLGLVYDDFTYEIKPSNPKPIDDGYIVDLGSKRLKVIHTPGHAPEAIMLLDEDSKELFTGDTYYPGHLYAHFEGEFYRNSQIDTYADSLEKAGDIAENTGIKILRPSHNDPVADPKILQQVAEGLRRIAKGKATEGYYLKGDLSVASLPDREDKYPAAYVIPENLFVYQFEDFQIIAKK